MARNDLKTYWNQTNVHMGLANQLQAMIPVEGAVANPRKNKALEKLRKAVNVYYDLYNNGLCNRGKEFRGVFGFAAGNYKYARYEYSDLLYFKVEAAMDDLVLAAAKEQGFTNDPKAVFKNWLTSAGVAV